MSTAYFQYRCRQCGNIHEPLGINSDQMTNKLAEMLTMKGHLFSLHSHSDGSIGVSDLIGAVVKVEFTTAIDSIPPLCPPA